VYKLRTTNQFEKDFIKCLKRNYNIEVFEYVLSVLENTGRLPSNYKSYLLSGKLKGYWECHIKPYWLLIWHQNEEAKIIVLVRTGTHADLFG
jgi:mRNA interferase YafQ